MHGQTTLKLEDEEVPPIISGQRHGRAEILCCPFHKSLKYSVRKKKKLTGILRDAVVVTDVKVLVHG